MNLSSTMISIQDIMRKDDGVDGDAQRIGQLAWMLFLKVFDQREEEWEDDAQDSGEDYQSPIPDEYRWRNWAAYKVDSYGKKQPQLSAEDTLRIANQLTAELGDLDVNEDPKRKVIRGVFEDSNNYMKSGTLMLAVIEKL